MNCTVNIDAFVATKEKGKFKILLRHSHMCSRRLSRCGMNVFSDKNVYKMYNNKLLYTWHHILTLVMGDCLIDRLSTANK